VLGKGKDHAKHQGGVAVGYRHLQQIEVVGDAPEYGDDEPNILRGVIEEHAAEHVADEYDAENGDIVPTETFDHDLAKRYPGKELEVHDVPNAFVFSVETDGSMSVEELVLEAVASIHDRADELEQAVQL
jgi:DNA-directed RNA polymerase subunit D